MTELLQPKFIPEHEPQPEQYVSLQQLRDAAAKLHFTSQHVGKNIDSLLQLARWSKSLGPQPYRSEDGIWYVDGVSGPVSIMRATAKPGTRFNDSHEYNMSGFNRLREETIRRDAPISRGTERFIESGAAKFFFKIAKTFEEPSGQAEVN